MSNADVKKGSDLINDIAAMQKTTLFREHLTRHSATISFHFILFSL